MHKPLAPVVETEISFLNALENVRGSRPSWDSQIIESSKHEHNQRNPNFESVATLRRSGLAWSRR